MRREPITEGAFKGSFCSNIKLSHRLKWRAECDEDEHVMIPSLLAVSVVNGDGVPIKSTDEWDEWAGDNTEEAAELFQRCVEQIGSVKEAKKN